MLEQLLQRLQTGDLSGLEGTDLALEVPISVRLIQEVLDSRSADGPLEELSLELLNKNRAILSFAADAPVIGVVRRELSLELRGEYDQTTGGHIVFDIVDGLKLFDKPIINLLQGQVESKLPAGISLNAKQIAIQPAQLLNALGYGYLETVLTSGKLETRQNQLVVFLHLKA